MERVLYTTTVAFLLKHDLFVETLRAILAGDHVAAEDEEAVLEVLECFGSETSAIIDAITR